MRVEPPVKRTIAAEQQGWINVACAFPLSPTSRKHLTAWADGVGAGSIPRLGVA